MSNFKILIKLKIQCKFVRLALLICILMQVFTTLKYYIYIYIYYPRTILHYMFKNNMPEKNGLMSLTLCHTHGTK